MVVAQSRTLTKRKPDGEVMSQKATVTRSHRTEHRWPGHHYRASETVAHPSAGLKSRGRYDPKTCVDLCSTFYQRISARTLKNRDLREKLQGIECNCANAPWRRMWARARVVTHPLGGCLLDPLCSNCNCKVFCVMK